MIADLAGNRCLRNIGDRKEAFIPLEISPEVSSNDLQEIMAI
jgi:hypothetical protein